MKAFHCDQFVLPLPAGHTFPVEKYARLRMRILAEGILEPDDLIEPEGATDGELRLAHDPAYVKRVAAGRLSVEEVRVIGLPWSPHLVERSRRSVGGTIAACRWALVEGVAANLAGGTHHASRDQGAGYCVFNDAAVAIRLLQREGRIKRALIVDLDVHQGDGTARIFEGDASVFTLSVHGERNYPLRKAVSDMDIGLPDSARDGVYLEAVAECLPRAIEQAGAELVVYLAGADPYEGDRLGRLGVSAKGLAERDRLVFTQCREAGLAVAVVMAGGYARVIDETVAIQAATIAEAVRWCRV